jgi:hypothetical protein
MPTGPVPGRTDPLAKGAALLRGENARRGPNHPPAAAAPAAPASLRRLAAKVIRGGTASQPAPPVAQKAHAGGARAPGARGADKYKKVFVGGGSMYVPTYDHAKTAGDGWGWLWG